MAQALLSSLQITSTIVHSAIADCGLWHDRKNAKGQVAGHQAVHLYYYLRAKDTEGSGWCDVSLDTVSKDLQISIYALRRWIKSGLDLKLFRATIRYKVGVVRVWYSCVENVCIDNGIADIGATAKIDISALSELKYIVTHAEALKLQHQSRYREGKKAKKCDRARKTFDANEIISSSLCTGPILFRRGRLIFLKRSHLPYGGSQSRIAWELGRHESTIQRRLSDSYRIRHGLDPIPKVQLLAAAKTVETFLPGRPTPIRRILPGQSIVEVPGLGKFRRCTNLYSEDLELVSCRRLRSRLKIRLQPSVWDDEWKTDPRYPILRSQFTQSIDKFGLLVKNSPPPELHHKDNLSIAENQIEDRRT